MNLTEQDTDDSVQDLSLSNKKCVFLICNKKYFFCLCVFVKNLSQHLSNFSIVVYDDGSLTDEDKNIIKNIKRQTSFFSYTFDKFCSKYNIDTDFKNNNFIIRYTHLNYIKFEIFKLLDEYDRIIYFDIDMLITRNIDELFKINCDIAWRNSIKLVDKLKYITESNKISLQDIDIKIDNSILAPNGGLLIVNKTFNYKLAYKIADNLLLKLFKFHQCSIDEIIFSLVTFKLHLKLHELNQKIYNVVADYPNLHAKIIHFMGDNYKPWRNFIFQNLYRDWICNYLDLNSKFNIKSEMVVVPNENENYFVKCMSYIFWGEFFLAYKNFIIPEDLKLLKRFDANYIKFKYYDNLFYELHYIFGTGSFLIKLLYNYKEKIQYVDIENILQNINRNINNYLLKFEKNGNSTSVTIKNIQKKDIVFVFNQFYQSTKELRTFSSLYNAQS